MRTLLIAILTAGILLLVACTGNTATPATLAQPAQSTPATGQGTQVLKQTPLTESTGLTPAQETSVASCATAEVTRIGQSIADSYPFTTVAEVMSWFCQGAEFEDILIALETEELNGTDAEEMLQMRAEGLSWEEIWQVVDLYKE